MDAQMLKNIFKKYLQIGVNKAKSRYFLKAPVDGERFSSPVYWHQLKEMGALTLPYRPPVGLLKKNAQDHTNGSGPVDREIIGLCNHILKLEKVFGFGLDQYFSLGRQRAHDGYCNFRSMYCSEEYYWRCTLCMANHFMSQLGREYSIGAYQTEVSEIEPRPSMDNLVNLSLNHPGIIQNEITALCIYVLKLENGLDHLSQAFAFDRICPYNCMQGCPDKGQTNCKKCNTEYLLASIAKKAVPASA